MVSHEIKEIDGAYIVLLDRHSDERGYFQEVFRSVRYDANIPHAVQCNLSCSKKNVVRGLHVANFAKYCTVLKGCVFDVIADVRKGSPTYGNWCGVWLKDVEHTQVYVPPGCAHGFYASEDDTVFLYNQDGLYNPDQDWSIHWEDKALNIQWPLADYYILSEKDKNAKEWQK
jgi:dTDP-4-dehydrorhamnose 3,5-epimerase